jgi:radical SAM superfamily enzyme YgiQ (UPF0313 family)|tara:strand:- start:134 stop:1738 length:1605 start_codon:yes stop_codon:yes gene_type:complete
MKKFLEIRLASVEDGLDNIGFRKISAYIKSIHSNTKVAYVPTGNVRSLTKILTEKGPEDGELLDQDILNVSQFLAEGNLVGLSSMTQYSTTVYKIVAKVRQFNPGAYIIWGGIHPIIQPEDAIKYADAVCTGEGEFAFKTFFELFKNGGDYTTTPSFWFRKNNSIIKNRNLPLMKPQEMDELPPLTYNDDELIYQNGKGFKTINYNDFVKYTALSYNTVWSIGCPLHCVYCGNTKFIEYDKAYRRIRHSSPRTMINEIKRAISKHPHLSSVMFHDDAFLSLPYAQLEEFAKLYKAEIRIPFAMFGVIPNYVREDKIALLLDAGMNRLRMGIQSGSNNILEFYKRPTKLHRIKEATEILNKFKKYMLPPSYDIILENPIETPEDTRATVDMLYEMPRPYMLNFYTLRIIPNTPLAQNIEDRGLKVPPIDKNYFIGHHRTLGNCLVFALTFWKMPRWLYKFLRNKVYPVHTKQPHYPILFMFVRTLYYIRRAFDHLRFMDFSVLPGKIGYYLWKFGIISFWQRLILKRYRLSKAKH